MVLAVLLTASSPVKDYSLAAADVAPVTANLAPPVDTVAVPEPAPGNPTASGDPAATPVADAPAADAPVVNAPVMAALELPDGNLPKPTLDDATRPNSSVGPQPGDLTESITSPEIVDECLVIETCADRFLWQLYQRTPKEDSIRESKQTRVTIKRKGKLRTVTRTTTFIVDEDFGWKDPKAAKNAGMSLMVYVIGGVDREFKLKLFRMLHAAEEAGLSPGITSGFRDDYRQSIASGLKAANNRSYHGGSSRGGYGHGLAADIVSTKGATRAERFGYSRALWKWVDEHGNEFGLGRPYLDRDPPHVAPVDGEEYAHHRPGVKARQAAAESNSTARVASQKN